VEKQQWSTWLRELGPKENELMLNELMLSEMMLNEMMLNEMMLSEMMLSELMLNEMRSQETTIVKYHQHWKQRQNLK
jgi:hypothetical protein